MGEYLGGRVAMMAKVIGRSFIIFLLFSVGAGVLVFFTLPSILIGPSETPPADAIINFSVDSRSKADNYIAFLYREGLARTVVTVSSQISHETYPADYVRDHLVALGVKKEDTRAYHLPITYCRAQVLAEVAKYLKTQGWRSVLIICQPEDSRSMRRLGHHILGQEGIKVAVGYAPEDYTEITTDWLQTHWKVQRFVNEAMNVAFDVFYSECR